MHKLTFFSVVCEELTYWRIWKLKHMLRMLSIFFWLWKPLILGMLVLCYIYIYVCVCVKLHSMPCHILKPYKVLFLLLQSGLASRFVFSLYPSWFGLKILLFFFLSSKEKSFPLAKICVILRSLCSDKFLHDVQSQNFQWMKLICV